MSMEIVSLHECCKKIMDKEKVITKALRGIDLKIVEGDF